MSLLPHCPKCQSEYTYEDQFNFVCPECSHEWPISDTDSKSHDDSAVTDAHGTPLQDGDTVTVIKDLKPKGASQTIKQGTVVKNIRLVEGDHNIDCKIPGFGAMGLKSEFVKKK